MCYRNIKTRNSLFRAILLLLGYPKAQILSLDDRSIHEVEYEETSSAQIVRHFVNKRETFLEELLKETPSMFPGSE
jgi:hypothetical protein